MKKKNKKTGKTIRDINVDELNNKDINKAISNLKLDIEPENKKTKIKKTTKKNPKTKTTKSNSKTKATKSPNKTINQKKSEYDPVIKIIKTELKKKKKKKMEQDEILIFLEKKKLFVEEDKLDEFLLVLSQNNLIEQDIDNELNLATNQDDFNILLNEETSLEGKRIRKSKEEMENSLSETNDIVKWYMRWIGKYGELLTADEEIELAQKIELGKLEIKKPENKQNKKVLRDAKKSRDMLIKKNLRLVINNAKKYKNRGLAFIDLISEGNSGIIKAVQKYDYKKGFKFSTYATWWIRQAITRAVADQARTIRVPVHMVETINKITKIKRELQQELGETPTDEQIAEKYGNDFTPEKVRYIRKINIDPISLDKTIGKEEDSVYSDFIADSTIDSPIDFASKQELTNILKDMVENYLDDEEKEIIKMRYGVGLDSDGNKMKVVSLDKIAEYKGMKKDKIRQWETKIIRKLKHPSRQKQLKEYRKNDY